MDQVGGDAFWIHEDETCSVLVVFDCMGHGRMATIMTSQYLNFLEKVVKEGGERCPAQILEKIHNEFKVQYSDKDHLLGTGADMGVLVYNKAKKEAYYSGAKLDLYQIVDGKAERLRGARIAIGEYFHKQRAYENTRLDLKRVSNFYMMSDGITDLFGGPKDKKFGSKNLIELVEESHSLEESEEKKHIVSTLNRWNRNNPPTDDMLLVSIRTPF